MMLQKMACSDQILLDWISEKGVETTYTTKIFGRFLGYYLLVLAIYYAAKNSGHTIDEAGLAGLFNSFLEIFQQQFIDSQKDLSVLFLRY